MPRHMWPLLWVAFGCGSDAVETDTPTTDTDLTPAEMCAGAGPTSVAIGTGSGTAFEAYGDGDEVGVDIAPQGGIGVPVRIKTTGLASEAEVSVQLDASFDGTLSATFSNPAVFSFCQAEGHGLIDSQVVGFDAELYPTVDQAIPLDGQTAELFVVVTDSRGACAESRVDVQLRIGAK